MAKGNKAWDPDLGAIEGRWVAIALDEKIQLKDWTPFIAKDGMRVNGRLGPEHKPAVISLLSFLIRVHLTGEAYGKNCGWPFITAIVVLDLCCQSELEWLDLIIMVDDK